jgi:hypothetical protein
MEASDADSAAGDAIDPENDDQQTGPLESTVLIRTLGVAG